MTGIDQLWERYPNPIVVDKDDLLDVVENLAIEDTPREDQEVFADWYRMVREEVREEAALERPAEMMLAELYAYPMYEAYRTTIRRNAETKHLQRMIRAGQIEQERLTSIVRRQSDRLDTLCSCMPAEVKRMCTRMHSCAVCPVSAAAHDYALDCRQYCERDPDAAETLATKWNLHVYP